MVFLIALIFVTGVVFIITGVLRINKKMIPYHIEAVTEGEKLFSWTKINGSINIAWGCILLLLSISTLFIENAYIWIFILIVSFIVKTIAHYKNNRKYMNNLY